MLLWKYYFFGQSKGHTVLVKDLLGDFGHFQERLHVHSLNGAPTLCGSENLRHGVINYDILINLNLVQIFARESICMGL